MARHRDIRNMDYEDEYDGYDDVYGHSIDDDYYISPSNRQFIYNRETSRESKFEHKDDIQEADEIDELSDVEKAKLNSCIDQITSILESISIPRSELVALILQHKFKTDLVINAILKDSKYAGPSGATKEKDDSKLLFKNIPNDCIRAKVSLNTYNSNNINLNVKLLLNKSNPFANPSVAFNKLGTETVLKSKSEIPLEKNKSANFYVPNIFGGSVQSSDKNLPNNFMIPNIFNTKMDATNSVPSRTFNIPNIFGASPSRSVQLEPTSVTSENFSTLNELASSHLRMRIPHKAYICSDQDNSSLEVISKGVSDIQLTQDNKSTAFTQAGGSISIDLSKALKPSGSLPNFSRNKENVVSAPFDIPFIDGDFDIKKRDKMLLVQEKLLPCTLTVRDLLGVKIGLWKGPSRLGKVICKKYRHAKRGNVIVTGPYEGSLSKKIKVFTFSTQSPDDFISSHIRR